MREILFRGKTKTGIWIEGFIFQTECDGVKEWCISMTPLSANDYSEILGDYGDVIPETVGQYTGLTDDKNGKKIFEGDIVAVYVKGCRTICTVSWAETVAHFQLWQINTIPGTPTALNLGNYDCEVIGNIHDNPELLKGGAE